YRSKNSCILKMSKSSMDAEVFRAVKRSLAALVVNSPNASTVPKENGGSSIFILARQVEQNVQVISGSSSVQDAQEQREQDHQITSVSGVVAKQVKQETLEPMEDMMNQGVEVPVPQIYIMGLPRSITREQVFQVFSRYGLVRENPTTRQQEIYIYPNLVRQCACATVLYTSTQDATLAIHSLNGKCVEEFSYNVINVNYSRRYYQNYVLRRQPRAPPRYQEPQEHQEHQDN
ncbi:unnamed protein product, partial [Didymodactylos carnosus]